MLLILELLAVTILLGGFFAVLGRLDDVQKHLKTISRKEDLMAATIADLDTALAQEDASLGTLAQTITDNDTKITALLQQIASGQPVDVTAELTKIQAQNQAVANAIAAVAASDARTS